MIFAIRLSNNHTLHCSELKVKHYKEILKATYGEDIDETSFLQTLSDVLCSVIDKPKEFFLNDVSTFDLLYLIIELRNQSLGNELGLTIKDKKTVTLNLQLVLNDIKDFCKIYENKFVEEANVKLKFSLPSVNRLLDQNQDESLYFLKNVKIKSDQEILTFINSNEEAKSVLDNISAKHVIKFRELFGEFLADLNEINFLKRYNVDTILGFVPTITNLIWFTKLLFNESLDVFYSNLFYLAKLGNMNPEYIENCAPGEYIYFVKQLEQSLSANNRSDTHDDLPTDEGEPEE
jgi:hypothetical protein